VLGMTGSWFIHG